MGDTKDLAKSMRNSGMTCKQVGAALGKSSSWVHKWTGNQGKNWRKWTHKEDDRLIEMKSYGRNDQYVARKLGRSINSVRLRWHRIPHKRLTREQKMRHDIEQALWMIRAKGEGMTVGRAKRAVYQSGVLDKYFC